jgi:heat shock protein HtpX
MATIYTHQGENIRKTWYLMTGFFIMVIGIGWAISYLLGNPSILVISVLFAIVMNIASFWFSDTLVIKMTGAKPADPIIHRELIRTVENLSITAGLPMPKVYVVNDPAPNAFATGRSPKHASVAATTGILSILDRSELEGVMAHELSHVGNRDMLVSTVAVVLAGFLSIIADMFLRASHTMGVRGDDRDSRVGGILMVLAVIGVLLAPIAGQMIQLAISRKREFLADASGAMLTRYPDALASALAKISANAQPMQRANHATAHLMIANPFGRVGGSLMSRLSALFATHPPVAERIKALKEMDV